MARLRSDEIDPSIVLHFEVEPLLGDVAAFTRELEAVYLGLLR
jgi:hypothetical protein